MTWFRRRDGERGQSLVEFALIIPIFLLVMMGLFDLGRAVFYQSTLANATREAARLAIVDQNVTAIQAKALESTSGIMPMSAADVVVTFPSGPCFGCPARVTITHGFTAATPFVGDLDLRSQTQLNIEYTYVSP